MLEAPKNPADARLVAVDLLLTSVGLFGCLGAFLWVAGQFAPLSGDVTIKLLVGGTLGVALLLLLATRHLSSRTFGAANRVTLTRGALVLLLAALIGEAPMPWLVSTLVTVVLMLDGVDGRLARKHGTASDFGARFDMETDAVFLLVLCMLVWQYDKAGVWILLAGLMRYLFIAASVLLRFLRRPLPPKRRRQAAFVTQAIVLGVCVAPVVPSPYSDALAFIGLAFLSWSFAVDVYYLATHND